MLKLHIYYNTVDTAWGGGNSFITALRRVLKQRYQCRIYDDINSDYDILLLNGGYKAPGKFIDTRKIGNIKSSGYSGVFSRLINGGKKKKRRIVHRLDGLRKIYAGIESCMDKVQLECIKYADFVIFQSENSLRCFQGQGFSKENFAVIHNGVNQDIFNFTGRTFWDGKRRIKVFSCSWSSNPNKGHQMIAEASLLDSVDVYFAGNWAKGVDPKKVKLVPTQEASRLAWYYRNCDLLLYPAKNETCPNTVLEALSCGLPVIYDASGGTPEVAAPYGVVLGDLKQSIFEAREKYYLLIENIKRDYNKFSIESAAQKYMDVFKKVCEEY